MLDPEYASWAQQTGMKVEWRTKTIQWYFQVTPTPLLADCAMKYNRSNGPSSHSPSCLLQLAEAFNLSNVTVHLAANYLDRYLSVRPVSGVGFQYVSAAIPSRMTLLFTR